MDDSWFSIRIRPEQIREQEPAKQCLLRWTNGYFRHAPIRDAAKDGRRQASDLMLLGIAENDERCGDRDKRTILPTEMGLDGKRGCAGQQAGAQNAEHCQVRDRS